MLVANQISFYVSLLFFIVFIIIFFMANVYLLITFILITTIPEWIESFRRAAMHSADFTPCFTVEKLVNCFLRHEYEKMTKTYHAPSIRFTHIWRIIFVCFHMCDTDVIISPSICGQVQLSSTEPLQLGFLNSERNNLGKFETS